MDTEAQLSYGGHHGCGIHGDCGSGILDGAVPAAGKRQRLGNELANQYAELELQDVRSAELLLTAGVWTMEDLEASGADADRVEEWARNYFQETVDRFPNQLVPYAVIDGKVITPRWGIGPDAGGDALAGSGGAIRGGDPAFKYADRFGIRTDCHCGIPEVCGVIGCAGV